MKLEESVVDRARFAAYRADVMHSSKALRELIAELLAELALANARVDELRSSNARLRDALSFAQREKAGA